MQSASFFRCKPRWIWASDIPETSRPERDDPLWFVNGKIKSHTHQVCFYSKAGTGCCCSFFFKVSVMLRKELTIHSKIKEYFWIDSQVVLSYINNNLKRFKILVTNRVELIKENSDVSQWMYTESKSNLADETSRGLSPSNQEKVKHWIKIPELEG